MTNWRRFLPWPVAVILFCGIMALVMRAQDKPVPPPTPAVATTPAQPTVEELQAQIAKLQEQVASLNGQLAATGKLYQACYGALAADETAQAAKK